MNTANLSREDARRRSAALQVVGYDVDVDVRGAADQSTTMFDTTTTVSLRSSESQTFLDFLDGDVIEVLLDDIAVDASYDGARITVAGLPTDREVTLTVRGRGRYSRSGEGLHRFVDPADGHTYLYTHYEPSDARRVYACFDQPDLKAPWRFTLTGPSDWQLLGNGAEIGRRQIAPGVDEVRFAETAPLSSYITALAAGPYTRVDDTWTSPSGQEVPLGVLCRASIAQHLDAQAIITVTKQGLGFFDEAFGYPYPWGKYDQIFVPEYNIGAMENPGLVTFTEAFVFRSRATRAQYMARANTILHEMAHMWFGDLVTPAWWDDLWLKESFAEYMGAHASVAATEFADAWVAFGGRRKTWAFTQDQLPTTHPIIADIPDVEAAKQNFDGITYAKGAAVLRQLVAFVGVEAFFAGARAYFAEHAFGLGTLADLLRAQEASSGRDLGPWAQSWLQTSGVDSLTPEVHLDGGVIAELAVSQESRDAVSGEASARPHRLGVGLYDLVDGQLRRRELIEIELDGAARTVVPGAAGMAAPAAVLLNDADLSYAKVGFDSASLRTWLDHLGALGDPLARVIVWSGLWNMTRDARLPAASYVDAVVRHGPREDVAATLASVMANLTTAIERYAPPDERTALRAATAERVWQIAAEAQPGSDAQLAWVRAFAELACGVAATAERAHGLLDGSVTLPGLSVDTEVRWLLWRTLASLGLADEDDLGAELRRDDTADGRIAWLACLARRPDPVVKQNCWERLLTPGALSNDHVDALAEGFDVPGQTELVAPFVERYFAALDDIWAGHSMEIAQRLVDALYPHADACGSDIEEHPLVVAARTWLADHPHAPAALRRSVLEHDDQVRRALRAQQG